MSNTRKNIMRDSIVICLVLILAIVLLTGVNLVTKDKIASGGASSAFDAFTALAPDAGGFVSLESSFPEGVESAAVAENGDYGFTVVTKGYGGEVYFDIVIGADGNYKGVAVQEGHSETPGIGAKIEAPEYLATFQGTNDPDSVDSIGGATVSSKALKKALKIASEALASVA